MSSSSARPRAGSMRERLARERARHAHNNLAADAGMEGGAARSLPTARSISPPPSFAAATQSTMVSAAQPAAATASAVSAAAAVTAATGLAHPTPPVTPPSPHFLARATSSGSLHSSARSVRCAPASLIAGAAVVSVTLIHMNGIRIASLGTAPDSEQLEAVRQVRSLVRQAVDSFWHDGVQVYPASSQTVSEFRLSGDPWLETGSLQGTESVANRSLLLGILRQLAAAGWRCIAAFSLLRTEPATMLFANLGLSADNPNAAISPTSPVRALASSTSNLSLRSASGDSATPPLPPLLQPPPPTRSKSNPPTMTLSALAAFSSNPGVVIYPNMLDLASRTRSTKHQPKQPNAPSPIVDPRADMFAVTFRAGRRLQFIGVQDFKIIQSVRMQIKMLWFDGIEAESHDTQNGVFEFSLSPFLETRTVTTTSSGTSGAVASTFKKAASVVTLSESESIVARKLIVRLVAVLRETHQYTIAPCSFISMLSGIAGRDNNTRECILFRRAIESAPEYRRPMLDGLDEDNDHPTALLLRDAVTSEDPSSSTAPGNLAAVDRVETRSVVSTSGASQNLPGIIGVYIHSGNVIRTTCTIPAQLQSFSHHLSRVGTANHSINIISSISSNIQPLANNARPLKTAFHHFEFTNPVFGTASPALIQTAPDRWGECDIATLHILVTLLDGLAIDHGMRLIGSTNIVGEANVDRPMLLLEAPTGDDVIGRPSGSLNVFAVLMPQPNRLTVVWPEDISGILQHQPDSLEMFGATDIQDNFSQRLGQRRRNQRLTAARFVVDVINEALREALSLLLGNTASTIQTNTNSPSPTLYSAALQLSEPIELVDPLTKASTIEWVFAGNESWSAPLTIGSATTPADDALALRIHTVIGKLLAALEPAGFALATSANMSQRQSEVSMDAFFFLKE